AISAQHPAGVADLHGAKDSSDPTGRIVLDWPECVAVWADTTKKGVGLGFMADDGALQHRHDLLSIVNRQTNIAIEQTLPALVDADLLAAGVAEIVLSLDCNRPLHRDHLPL